MLIEDLQEQPGHLIRRAHQISGAAFAARLAGFDLTAVQFAAMVAVAGAPGTDATRVAELIAFDKATLGGVLDRLEAKGLLQRSPSPQDRRMKSVALTPAGQALLAEVEGRVLEAQADMLGPLSAGERRQLIGLLKKIAAPRSDGI